MAGYLPFLTNKNILTFKVAPIGISNSLQYVLGTFVDIAVPDGLATFEGFQISSGNRLENFMPTGLLISNFDSLGKDFTFTVREMMAANGDANINIAVNNGLEGRVQVELVYRVVGASSGRKVAARGILENYEESYADGVNIAVASFKPIASQIWRGAEAATPFF